MRVAWIQNSVGPHPGLLPAEFAGGGEMADAGMIAHAPAGVEVTRFAAADWEQALDHDRIIIAATDQLDRTAMLALAARRPMVWVHHLQTRTQALHGLLAAADPFIAMSREHAELEQAWSAVPATWNHGVIDPDDVAPADKTHDALWAARDHPQKGLTGARIWAHTHGRQLTELTNVPRADVLAAMAVHRTFVFLPKGFDACPRTVLEAELAGCEIVTNQNVGRRDPGDLREVLLAQPGKFWGWL